MFSSSQPEKQERKNLAERRKTFLELCSFSPHSVLYVDIVHATYEIHHYSLVFRIAFYAP